jgi:hypothetical protein
MALAHNLNFHQHGSVLVELVVHSHLFDGDLLIAYSVLGFVYGARSTRTVSINQPAHRQSPAIDPTHAIALPPASYPWPIASISLNRFFGLS